MISRLTPRRSLALALVLVVLAAGASALAVHRGSSSATADKLVSGGGASSAKLVPVSQAPAAPELAGVTHFLNTPPVSMSGLRGRVVLVDFWTYSCINCRRTFPFLRGLQQTYGARGLTVLGVHSPEFGFEQDPANVAAAVKRLGVTWPVAEDPSMATWNAWGNQYWPADYLVDREGRVRFFHAGEGEEAQTEQALRTLLDDGGSAGTARAVASATSSAAPGAADGVSPELYLGSSRSGEDFDGGRAVPAGLTVTRSDRGDVLSTVSLHGRFTGQQQWLATAGTATVRLRYRAQQVYALLAPDVAGRAVQVEVRLDGRPVPAGRRGSDVHVLPDGRTVVTVGDDDLRSLVTGPAVAQGRLTLTAPAGLRLYTFTFGP